LDIPGAQNGAYQKLEGAVSSVNIQEGRLVARG